MVDQPGAGVTQRGDADPIRADPGSASRRRRSARGSGSTAAVIKSWTRRAQASSPTSPASRLRQLVTPPYHPA